MPVGKAIGFFKFGLFNVFAGVQLNLNPSVDGFNLTESVNQIDVSAPAFSVTKSTTLTLTES